MPAAHCAHCSSDNAMRRSNRSVARLRGPIQLRHIGAARCSFLKRAGQLKVGRSSSSRRRRHGRAPGCSGSPHVRDWGWGSCNVRKLLLQRGDLVSEALHKGARLARLLEEGGQQRARLQVVRGHRPTPAGSAGRRMDGAWPLRQRHDGLLFRVVQRQRVHRRRAGAPHIRGRGGVVVAGRAGRVLFDAVADRVDGEGGGGMVAPLVRRRGEDAPVGGGRRHEVGRVLHGQYRSAAGRIGAGAGTGGRVALDAADECGSFPALLTRDACVVLLRGRRL